MFPHTLFFWSCTLYARGDGSIILKILSFYNYGFMKSITRSSVRCDGFSSLFEAYFSGHFFLSNISNSTYTVWKCWSLLLGHFLLANNVKLYIMWVSKVRMIYSRALIYLRIIDNRYLKIFETWVNNAHGFFLQAKHFLSHIPRASKINSFLLLVSLSG